METLKPEDLWNMSKRLTLRQAATQLKVGETKLKKMCRLHGMRFWPHRLFQSYFKMLETPVLTENDKMKLKIIISSASSHKFAFCKEQKDILNRARQKAYKYEHSKNCRASGASVLFMR